VGHKGGFFERWMREKCLERAFLGFVEEIGEAVARMSRLGVERIGEAQLRRCKLWELKVDHVKYETFFETNLFSEIGGLFRYKWVISIQVADFRGRLPRQTGPSHSASHAITQHQNDPERPT
jgi:hypothetical protein